MDISSEVFYVLILLVSAISILLLVFLLLYLKSQKKIAKIELESEELKKQNSELQNTGSQVDNTQIQKVLNEAYKKASEIIESAQAITEEQKQVVIRKLEGLVNEQSVEYQNMLANLSKTSDTISQYISQSIKVKLDQDITKISASIQMELEKSSQIVQQGVTKLYSQFENDYGTHKAEILKKLDFIVTDIFKNVASEAIGQSLTKKQEEALVIRALEEAKRNSFFSSGKNDVTNKTKSK